MIFIKKNKNVLHHLHTHTHSDLPRNTTLHVKKSQDTLFGVIMRHILRQLGTGKDISYWIYTCSRNLWRNWQSLIYSRNPPRFNGNAMPYTNQLSPVKAIIYFHFNIIFPFISIPSHLQMATVFL